MESIMNIKDKILEELQNVNLDNGYYDTNLSIAKSLDKNKRRQLIFELEEEGKIKIKKTNKLYDADFPLIITYCTKK